MRIYPHPFFYRLLLSAALLGPLGASAQSSVWNSAPQGKKAAGKKTTDTKHKLKDIKQHAEQWGMDSSYNHALLLGGKLNSDGWSGSVQLMKRKNYTNTRVLNFSFSEIKHEKQTKLQGTNATFTYLGNGSPYVYGKINNLYTLQVGYGRETLLLPAVMEGNISVSFRYTAGLRLAMLKPYDLKLIYVDYSSGAAKAHTEQQSYNRADSATFLNTAFIQGASTWSRSLPDITYVPGGYLETSLCIIPGKSKAIVQEIILGINASVYAKELPLMADQKARPWEVALFAGLGIGKRWK